MFCASSRAGAATLVLDGSLFGRLLPHSVRFHIALPCLSGHQGARPQQGAMLQGGDHPPPSPTGGRAAARPPLSPTHPPAPSPYPPHVLLHLPSPPSIPHTSSCTSPSLPPARPRTLNRLARILRQQRAERGALQLASPEVKFEIDTETHDPLDVGMYQVWVCVGGGGSFFPVLGGWVGTFLPFAGWMDGCVGRHSASKGIHGAGGVWVGTFLPFARWVGGGSSRTGIQGADGPGVMQLLGADWLFPCAPPPPRTSCASAIFLPSCTLVSYLYCRSATSLVAPTPPPLHPPVHHHVGPLPLRPLYRTATPRLPLCSAPSRGATTPAVLAN